MGNCSRRQDTQQQEAGAQRQLLMLFSAKANREVASQNNIGGPIVVSINFPTENNMEALRFCVKLNLLYVFHSLTLNSYDLRLNLWG